MTRLIVAIALCVGCAPSGEPGVEGYSMKSGEVREVGRFTAVEGQRFRFVVLDVDGPVSVGLERPDGLDRNTAWPVGYSPFAAEGLRPLVAGEYQVLVGCGETTRACVFGLEVVVE